MKKKLLSVLLVLTLVLGLSSCGGKDKAASLSTQVDKMADMKVGYAELAVDMDTDAFKEAKLDITKLSLKIAAHMDKDSDKKGKLEISYKLDSAEFAKLTTLVLDGEVIYANLKELKEAAPSLMSKLGLDQYQGVLAVIPDTEYVKIDPATIAKMGGVSAEVTGSLSYSKEDMKNAIKIMSEVVKVVEEAIKDVKPAVIASNGDKVTVNVTGENAKATLEALAKTDFSKTFDSVIKQMEGIEACKEMATQYKGKKDDILKQLKEGLEKGATDAANMKDVALNYSLEVTGSEGQRVAEHKLTLDGKNDKNYAKVTLTSSMKEGQEESVEVPTEATDLMQIMASLMGSGMAN